MDTIRVLITDDHPIFRHGLAQLLDQQPGIKVVAQAGISGEEAVRLVNELAPDLVILDMVLPGMNGVEVVREIKASLPDTALLVLSAYDDEAYTVAALKAGAAGYLPKDASADEVVEAVRLVHDGGMVFKEVNFRELLDKALKYTNGKKAQPDFSRREMEIVRLVASGMSNHNISLKLELSERTVENHLGRFFHRVKVNSRTELVSLALREGWLSVHDLSSPGRYSPDHEETTPPAQTPRPRGRRRYGCRKDERPHAPTDRV